MSPPSSFSWRALLSFPYRLCNPPPAAGNVRSCKVTPLVKLSLDDVLNKRHLPPLTLKDFEEWLVFVEGCPQYLYFLLWFKEYELRYTAWLQESGCEFPSNPSPSKSLSTTTVASLSLSAAYISDSFINLIPPSPSLALFFTRAKQTFLDLAPHAQYALGPDAIATLAATNSPSTYSAPDDAGKALLHLFNSHPHPHPREFIPITLYARKLLKERLERFAASAVQNSGSRRAWCGVAGGTVMLFLIGILPTLVALFWASSRWWRLVGVPGCLMGITVIIASFHGICMGIYIFGDFRQLRSFELARPAISSPHAIAHARPRLRSYFTDKNVDIAKNPSSEAVPGLPPKKSIPSTNSETSTGTPLARFGNKEGDPGMLSGATSLTEPIFVSGTQVDSGFEKSSSNGGGIKISPAYFPDGTPVGQRDASGSQNNAHYNTVGLASERSRVERIFSWLQTREASQTGMIKTQEDYHKGTFGVSEGPGCLSDDVEKGYLPETGQADTEYLTAEFISREDDEDGSTNETPVQFDFDKLPPLMSLVSSRRVPLDSSPSSGGGAPRPISHSSHFSSRPITPLNAALPSPPPKTAALPLYSHPGARISAVPSSSRTSLTTPPTCESGSTRQWWDNCPRHPEVDAALASYARSRPPSGLTTPMTPSSATLSFHSRVRVLDKGGESEATTPPAYRARIRRVMDVPAFGPLTRVLSPVVARGQWEIVVRSAMAALMLAWALIGIFLALPEVHRRR